MIFGKLATSGVLNNIYDRDPIIWEDGSMDVELLEMPTFDGPYGYDAPNKMATPNPTQASINDQIAALDTIIKGFGIQVPMEMVDDLIVTTLQPKFLPGFSFDIKPNESWHAQWTVYASGSIGGIKFGVAGPTAPMSVKFSADGNIASVSDRTVSMITSSTVMTPIAFIAHDPPFVGKVQLDLHFVNGSNPGKIQIRVSSVVGGQSNTVFGGSFGRSWRAAV